MAGRLDGKVAVVTDATAGGATGTPAHGIT